MLQLQRKISEKWLDLCVNNFGHRWWIVGLYSFYASGNTSRKGNTWSALAFLRYYCDCNYCFIFFLLLCWVGVHCSIYKSSYNISNVSYLNTPPQLLSLIPPSTDSWNSFNKYHFCILHRCVYIICTIFTLLLLSLPSPPSHQCQPPTFIPQAKSVSPSCSLIL
jgi:hypothetical protein